jgi:mannose-6-phosphate isomerase-like protein (cupin superfamily)
MSYAIKNLREVDDSAVKHGYSDRQEARFAREDVGAERTGFTYHLFKPGKRQAFGHRHEQAEEVYVVLSGSGRVRLDDQIVEIGRLDAVRVDPQVMRSFEAGPDGLEILAFGAHHPGDGEVVMDFWAE